jgi:hypothetical protein
MDAETKHRLVSIKQALLAYDEGRLDLNGLISNIEVLQVGLTCLSENWRDDFRQQWGVLEQVYSVAVVREQPVETPTNRELIKTAMKKMRMMVDHVLNNC